MHRRTRPARLAALALGTAALTVSGLAGPATSAPDPNVLAKKLLAPLSLAAAEDGSIYFSENFAGRLHRLDPDGTTEELFSIKKGEVGAISVADGVVTFAVSRGNNEVGRVKQLIDGEVVELADLAAHENAENPDGEVTYGFAGVKRRCLKQLPPYIPGTYPGVAEVHPFATVSHEGTVYVADAGANAVFAVTDGVVSTLAVVPPAPVTVTKKLAKGLGLPACTVGKDYLFEGVPTDIEVGPDGLLYLSSLPGGPEDGSTGANGGVFTIDPATGETTLLGRGLISAAGIAVAEDGTVYASELFPGRIVSFAPGSNEPTPVAERMMPSALEIVDGSLVASTAVLTGLSGGPEDKPKGRIEVVPLD